MPRRAAVALSLLAACAAPPADEPATAAEPQQVSLIATDFAFAAPDSIAPGVTRLHFVNTGAETHHVILGRLDEGKTMADLQAFMEADPEGNPTPIPDFITWEGGVGVVMPGDSAASISDLPAGQYILFCFIPSPDGVPHLAKGMIRPMTVAGDRVAAPAPEVEATIELNEFAFVVPELTAGTHTFRITNTGQQVHEIGIVRLDDGATLEQYMAATAPGSTTPPPGRPLGGNGAISPGVSNYLTVTLEPGRYVLVCFVPDAADGAPHVVKGMVQEVVIS